MFAGAYLESAENKLARSICRDESISAEDVLLVVEQREVQFKVHKTITLKHAESDATCREVSKKSSDSLCYSSIQKVIHEIPIIYFSHR